MVKNFIVFLLLLFITLSNAQNYKANYAIEDYDTWGTVQLKDSFGDESDETICTYLTKGTYIDIKGEYESMEVMALVDLKRKQLAVNIYNGCNELIKNINFDGKVLIKDMGSNDIDHYLFKGTDWTSNTLMAPITEGKYRAIPVKYLLDGNGQVVKFKMEHSTEGPKKYLGEYNFSILAWDDTFRNYLEEGLYKEEKKEKNIGNPRFMGEASR
ncbi:hypothetical protein SAMN04487911_1072 [Arenibacter nanhaiticus]|uniref:Uncharacterized protein n=1 Tax=Arenibacter nanhaiticus TaxID=558155 RepID=A0A1M6EP90_9FLAO|nr:hypothetical protein [Arenibacter nanhaiticus]SHI87282.1 hypothetical protein SAMN04487911_1072 [Arenibacter nanhaiticus]